MLSFVVISKIAAHGTHKNATIGHIMAGGKGVATGLHPYHQTPTSQNSRCQRAQTIVEQIRNTKWECQGVVDDVRPYWRCPLRDM